MNQGNVVASLKQIRSLASECLKAIGNGGYSEMESGKSNGRKGRTSGNALPDRILELRDKLFFKEPMIAREVHEKLHDVYPCELNRVAMALLRLKGRKLLRKASKVVDGKRQIAYVW